MARFIAFVPGTNKKVALLKQGDTEFTMGTDEAIRKGAAHIPGHSPRGVGESVTGFLPGMGERKQVRGFSG